MKGMFVHSVEIAVAGLGSERTRTSMTFLTACRIPLSTGRWP